MNAETLLGSMSTEDLKAILRFMSDDSSGTHDDLKKRVQSKSEHLSWKYLLAGVPKESLQKICSASGLRNDLSKDELIDEIVRSFPKPVKKGLLRDMFSPWQRWTTPGQRGRR